MSTAWLRQRLSRGRGAVCTPPGPSVGPNWLTPVFLREVRSGNWPVTCRSAGRALGALSTSAASAHGSLRLPSGRNLRYLRTNSSAPCLVSLTHQGPGHLSAHHIFSGPLRPLPHPSPSLVSSVLGSLSPFSQIPLLHSASPFYSSHPCAFAHADRSPEMPSQPRFSLPSEGPASLASSVNPPPPPPPPHGIPSQALMAGCGLLCAF